MPNGKTIELQNLDKDDEDGQGGDPEQPNKKLIWEQWRTYLNKETEKLECRDLMINFINKC